MITKQYITNFSNISNSCFSIGGADRQREQRQLPDGEHDQGAALRRGGVEKRHGAPRKDRLSELQSEEPRQQDGQ